MLYMMITQLISCTDQDPSEHVFTLELIGDSTVYIEEGSVYVDQGISVDGEELELHEVSYRSNLDSNRVGTYYIEFFYYEQSITRTLVVTEGAKTIYTRMVDALKNAESYSYGLDLDIYYRQNEQDVNINYTESYDIFGDYAYGQTIRSGNTESYNNSEYTLIDHERGIKERYSFDDNGYWYNENPFYERPYVANTKLVLDYFSYATREKVEEDYVYTIYLKPGAYDAPFYEYINFIEHTSLNNRSLTPLEITVYSKDGQISKIVFDMSLALFEHLKQPTAITELSYVFTFEFSNINQLEPVVIPPEALEKKE